MEQINIIKKLLTHYYHNVPVYLCGDFNIDFNGNAQNRPELNKLEELQMNDVWSVIHPDRSGFTEDTEINDMRYNTKQIDKQVRFDAILYKPLSNINPTYAELFGNTMAFKITYDRFIKMTSHLELDPNKGFKHNGTMSFNLKPQSKLTWYPSDHFGLTAIFDHN